MKRRDALKGFVVAPWAWFLKPTTSIDREAVTKGGYTHGARFDNTANDLSSLMCEMIEHWSGGIRPVEVRYTKLAKTGDAEKWVLQAQHPRPEAGWHEKTILLSGLMLTIDRPGRKSEIAYQMSKKGREIARDWAYMEWGKDGWLHRVPPHSWIKPWEDYTP